MRHGEKPAAGLGQLNCRGLNRSLALPNVLLKQFGKPVALFAPNPGIEKKDGSGTYNYVRPLATIEPTAIRLGMPVDTRFSFEDIAGLKSALLAPPFRDAVVFVAWEHREAESLARDLMKTLGGDAASVPRWNSDNFDSLYVIRIDTAADGSRKSGFGQQYERLNDQPDICPGA
ncbi:MAG TPA: hypothetical protein VFW00_13055, partial [Rhodocyclaceae bacterium]|nr:hypothetical protein [Rhodocyclaceae bacterium]